MSDFYQPVHLNRKWTTGVSVTKSLGIGVGFLFGEGFIVLQYGSDKYHVRSHTSNPLDFDVVTTLLMSIRLTDSAQ